MFENNDFDFSDCKKRFLSEGLGLFLLLILYYVVKRLNFCFIDFSLFLVDFILYIDDDN